MSFLKSDGARIEIEFTEPLNKLTYYLGAEHRTLTDATITAQNYYSTSYLPSLMNDGVANTSYYWYGTTAANWIKISFKEKKLATGFRWYKANSTYRPSTFTVSGSNDDTNWTSLSDTLSTQSTSAGWEAFTFTNSTEYLYYKIDILTSASTRIYLAEIELLLAYGNEKAFTVTVPEYQYVPNGPIENNEKIVKGLEIKENFLQNLTFKEGEHTNTVFNNILQLEKDIESTPYDLPISSYLNTTTGMTVLRNNVANDDGTDTVVGVDWFKFNNVVTNNLYSSGNSWTGFGSSAEHLKVCRRDGKMYYLYRQEGTVAGINFLKIRWEGYSVYNSTSATYALKYEVFIFDTGVIYLNLIQVPTSSSYLGTNELVCGSNTYPFTVTTNTPVEYTFYPQDSNGSTWTVVNERPKTYGVYLSGNYIQTFTGLNRNVVTDSLISWQQEVPEDTTLTVSVSTDGSTYFPVNNEGTIITNGIILNTLYLKIEMSTTDTSKTPKLSNMTLLIKSENDEYILVLYIKDTERFNSAVGNISVEYDNEIGNLTGLGGPVESFSLSFTPTGLLAKPHQQHVENIEITNIEASGELIKIEYHDTKCDERIEISDIIATGVLTHINDL